MDIFEKCPKFTEARDIIRSGYYPYFIPMSGSEGTAVEYKGRKLIMCGSNNYLGLTTHPEVRQAAIDAIQRFGPSCTGSRFLNGTLELHEQLEKELAEYVGKPAALVFSTGMQANLGTISALVGRGDIVILDKEDHASIVDGARLSWGKIHRFAHNDMNDLERLLAELPANAGKLVIVDGVFSMEGDIVALPELVRICKRFGARVMVDDAHALGVLGKGRGTAEHFGLTREVDLIMSTFSKSLASLGGFIAGEEEVIHYIKHHARAFIFSASISPPNAAAALAALRVMKREPERVQRVNQIAENMRGKFGKMGYKTGKSATPIIPLFMGSSERTFMTWKKLFDNGIFVNATVPPAVTDGNQLLRTSYMATHTEQQLEQILAICERVGKEVGLLK